MNNCSIIIKVKKMKKIIFSILKTFLAIIAMFINVRSIYKSGFTTATFKLELISLLILGLLIFVFFYKKESRKSLSIVILSSLFSVFMIFGNSFKLVDSWNLVFGNLIVFIISILMFFGYFFIFKLILSILYDFLEKTNILKKDIKKNKVVKFFDEHPFICSLIIMIVCWLPYIIAYYPIILSPDPSYQIKQFFGIDTKYSYYNVLIDPNVLITNAHPVLHTLLIGGCLNIGHVLGSDNLGLFIYSIIQIVILSSTLAYTIKYMKKINLPIWFRLFSLGVYALVPIFPFYSMSGVKDVIFSALMIHYLIMMDRIVRNANDKKISIIKLFLCTLLMILVCLFRHNGIYVIALSFPFLFLVDKLNRKRLIAIFVILVGFYGCYNKVILPAFKITPGSPREMLSIPFQQTARYVKYHSEELTDEDKEKIDYILEYDTLADRYDPELSDDVKNKYNRFATSEDLKDYFGVWFKGLFRHPGTYIQATINNVYGYFYPNKTSWYIYYKYDTRILKDGFDYHYNGLDGLRNVLSDYGDSYQHIPVIGMITNIAFNVWLVFIMTAYLLSKKQYKEVIFLIPTLVSILVCIAGPANTYYRYALPFIMSMPLMIGMFLMYLKKSK